MLPDSLDRASVHRLVRGMFPRDKVEEEIGVKIIACIGLGAERAPLSTQVSNNVAYARLLNFYCVGLLVEVVGYGVSVLDVSKGAETTLRGDVQLPQLCHSAVDAFLERLLTSVDGILHTYCSS